MASSTKSEATRTPLSGRSKESRGQFPPKVLRSNQLGHILAPPAYVNLKEQEIRNIVWITECILQQQKDEIGKFVLVFSQHAPWRLKKNM